MLLLVWNLHVAGAPNAGVVVAPELGGPAFGKPLNPPNAGMVGVSPSFFSANAAMPNVGAADLGGPVVPTANSLKPLAAAVGLLLLVWNLNVVGAPNAGVVVAPELEGPAF